MAARGRRVSRGKAADTDQVLYDAGESIRELLRSRCAIASEVEIVFEAPTRDWAARRSGPAIDVFLYDIRENLERRANLFENVRDGDLVTGRVAPTRWFNCSYLITAWTQRPDDEHRLLGQILQGLLTTHALPRDCLRGQLALTEREFFLTLGRPLGSERSISDIWSALGGELKPSLDFVLCVPFEPAALIPVGPPVLEAPSLFFGEGRGPAAKRGKGGKDGVAGKDGEAGKDTPDSDPGREPGYRRAKEMARTEAEAAEAAAREAAERDAIAKGSERSFEEAVAGTPEHPGRRFRFAVHEPSDGRPLRPPPTKK